MGSIEQANPNSCPGHVVETDLLIVGAGPAGSSLASFLARYGLKGIMISAQPGTADTPRAHLTNMSAIETMRDIGLQDEIYRLGKQGDQIMHYRWCETMAGEEYARVTSWGNSPARKGDYEVASPCPGCVDLPQTLLEPLLVGFATLHGFNVRFNTTFISFSRDDKSQKITSFVKDSLSGIQYRIVSKYLFGADGGRSPVVEQLGLPLTQVPGGGLAYNCLIRCKDLGNLLKHQSGNLHWNLRLERDDPWIINFRMVKPWFEWMMVALPKDPFNTYQEWTVDEWKAAFRDLVQDPDAEVEVLNISKWQINEVSADKYSEGNIFCLGDAVHRHPPVNGLGSNTCIGDSFNLAWKINLVMKGVAHPSLLETYNTERQPVGAEVVRMSNAHLRRHITIWQLLGMQPPGKTLEERTAGIKALKAETEEGRQKRIEFRQAVQYMHHETHALGLEMGHKYFGPGIYDADEERPWTPPGQEAEDPILYYEPCSYPGRRLPHVWLGHEVAGPLISTQDLAGKGKFCLFTGPMGQNWKVAAANVSKELGLPITAVSIGARQEYNDIYQDWAGKRGIEEDGALLVRPDLFTAWRSQRCRESEAACTEKLRAVMRSILGWGHS